MKDHFVLINWNEKGNSLIKNIKMMQKEIGSHAEIVVVSKTLKDGKSGYLIINEDPLSSDLSDKTNMRNARSVIIMNEEDISPDAADTKNILIILNIAKQLKGIVKQPHIVLEISSPDKVHLLSEGDLDVEVVSTKNIASDLLVQVSVNPGLTEVYKDLLTNEKGSSEIYSIELNSNWAGKTFNDIFTKCAEMRSKDINVLPLAIRRGSKTFLNPSKKSLIKIEEGDVLFTVCDNIKVMRKLNDI
jgi:hypothetical protein